MKKWKPVLCALLIAAIGCSVTLGVAAAPQAEVFNEQRTKISHSQSPIKTVDGIVDYIGDGVVSAADQGQGDRGQSYSWAAIAHGDDVYVSTCYNAMGNTLTLMDSALGQHFDPETMTAILNVLYNGSFYTGEEDGGSAGGILVKVNAVTGEVTLLMSKATTGENCLFRNACEYQGKFYFCGSVNSLPCIYQVDPETDACKLVYQGMTRQDYIEGYIAGICTGIRGLCEFNGQLIVSCVTKTGHQILSSTIPGTARRRSPRLPARRICLITRPITMRTAFMAALFGRWFPSTGVCMCPSAPGTPDNMPDENTMQSFALVRGDQDEDGVWSWHAVIGDQWEDGAKYPFGIDPSRTRAGAGVLMVYGDYLYIGEYNDEEIALENVLFDIDFDFVNENLRQSVNLYRMDREEQIELVVGDPTPMFPEGGISGIGSGFGQRENQYIWRMTEYDGKLFVGTFDTSSLLEPIGQFSNGDIQNMTKEEWESLLAFIRTLLRLQHKEEGTQALAASQEETRMAGLVQLFDTYTDAQLAACLTGESIRPYGTEPADTSIQDLLHTAKGILTCAHYLKDSVRGFDCYVTSDGTHFETITTNGFEDPYNHGLRVFAETDSGLCIGTANPFYGTQLWKMSEISTGAATFSSNLDIDFHWQITQYQVTAPANTRVFDFTMTPANSRNVILVNGAPIEGHRAQVPLVVGQNTVVVTNQSAGGEREIAYTFQITVPPCNGGANCPSARFTDVDPTGWYHEGLDYVVEHGFMNGITGNLFAPNEPVTRGMVMTVLYRMAGTPQGTWTSPYTDVAADRYFSEAVAWATEAGIATGYPGGVFRPDQPVTRQELATFLWRYAQDAGMDTTVSEDASLKGYRDAGSVQHYAQEAMLWAVATGLIQGVGADTLAPTGTATGP